ncbi:MAG: DMSO/TMAO reductase YedYZ heme-binding membrane subunit [Bacteroidia bacterium]|jgi:DMSO/TMAO reductase YedYZ heme-binding membrane subunit
MSVALDSMFKNRAINGWPLFALIAIPISILVILEMMSLDMYTASAVSEMIGYSVRLAIPFIYIVVAASSLQTLYPSVFSRWLLRNRKYVGLCFAVAMAWQGLYIFIISTFFREYYFEKIYVLRDEIEGTVGYIFLSLMVLTSFQVTRKKITQKQWKLIQQGGIYILWAYPFSVYWWNLYYYEGPPLLHDYIFYWAGFIAFALRIAAWGKKRLRAAEKADERSASALSKTLGSMFVALGLFASATGSYWQDPASVFLTSQQWSADLAVWFPFWPFEPFLPLATIGLGALLLTWTRPHPGVVPITFS